MFAHLCCTDDKEPSFFERVRCLLICRSLLPGFLGFALLFDLLPRLLSIFGVDAASQDLVEEVRPRQHSLSEQVRAVRLGDQQILVLLNTALDDIALQRIIFRGSTPPMQ